MTHPTIERARARVLSERRPADRELLATVAELPQEHVPELFALSDEVRAAYCGDGNAVEALYNAKKGVCAEDCNHCSQNARFATDVEPEPISSVEGFLEAARDAYDGGAAEFCIVVAVRRPSVRLIERVCTAVPLIKQRYPLIVAVSLGLLHEDDLAKLVKAGVDKVNHNLETSRRYFPMVCTTHSYGERLKTCRLIKQFKLRLCCGGVIGLGETVEDHLDFLEALQELQPDEIPVNFFNPRSGSPFGTCSLVAPLEALRFAAMVRLALPSARIRFAGGREATLAGLQDLDMHDGSANCLALAHYESTSHRQDEVDFSVLDRLGFEVLA